MGRTIPSIVFLSFFASYLRFGNCTLLDREMLLDNGGTKAAEKVLKVKAKYVDLKRFLAGKQESYDLLPKVIKILDSNDNKKYLIKLDECAKKINIQEKVKGSTKTNEKQACDNLLEQFGIIIKSSALVGIMEVVLNGCEKEKKKEIIDFCMNNIRETQPQINHLQEVQSFLEKFEYDENSNYNPEECNELIKKLGENFEKMKPEDEDNKNLEALIKSVEDSDKKDREKGIWDKLLGGIKDFIEKHFAEKKELSGASEENPFPGVKSDYVHQSQTSGSSPSEGVPGRVILKGGPALVGGGRQYTSKEIAEFWKDPRIRMGCSMNNRGQGCTKAQFFMFIREHRPGAN